MISIKDESPLQLNRANSEIAKETFKYYKDSITSIDNDTKRVLELLKKTIQFRTAQLMLLEKL